MRRPVCRWPPQLRLPRLCRASPDGLRPLPTAARPPLVEPPPVVRRSTRAWSSSSGSPGCRPACTAPSMAAAKRLTSLRCSCAATRAARSRGATWSMASNCRRWKWYPRFLILVEPSTCDSSMSGVPHLVLHSGQTQRPSAPLAAGGSPPASTAQRLRCRTRQVQLHEISSCNITGRRGSDPDALMSASDLRIRLRFFHFFKEDARHLFTPAARGRRVHNTSASEHC